MYCDLCHNFVTIVTTSQSMIKAAFHHNIPYTIENILTGIKEKEWGCSSGESHTVHFNNKVSPLPFKSFLRE